MTRPAATTAKADHYTTLGLSSGIFSVDSASSTRDSLSTSPPSTKDVKIAYKRALLRHHPDKLRRQQGRLPEDPRGLSQGKRQHTIDDITLAYSVLSSPKARAEYDRLLRLEPQPTLRSVSSGANYDDPSDGRDDFRSVGLETVDLDDLNYDPQRGVWYRTCRCGGEAGSADGSRVSVGGDGVSGFVISEQDLEDGAEFGVVITGCGGCSLWLEVLFEMVEEDGVEERVGEADAHGKMGDG